LNEEIHTDKEILYEILQNLFSNAIKFSPRGKSITLKSITENDRLKYEITDEGPGFTDSDKQKMFTKFSRLSAKPTGDEHSTGLGLSIVKRLCELIGGDVVLESLENKGSKFVVSLPFHL
jgi:signal transduction histidine kinase